MTYKLTAIDMKVIEFVKIKLQEGKFNISKWDLKEIPLKGQVYTFQNKDDSVEFSAFVNEDHITLGYDKLNTEGFITEAMAESVQEAIENTDLDRKKLRQRVRKVKTIFEI
ncbi:hypothetical protein [Liquorilactobacillus hordei]|uniref:Uncharacterized protein n=1 Tax=Liquorilactobacillus hordei TaxID=468911 RepID=A0A3Q8CLS7_9LACO|nr:hypothetical protein [Liquorilactobacillus hordei]AUJ29617.1 hypothetical protein BSQ49_05025 [Liquorilactobacillus hordei]